MDYTFYLADVFTDRIFGGNQLAVLPDADGLDQARMQELAREFNFSETAFVFPPQDPAHTRRVRIFTPAKELPFAGHPTVGTAAVLAECHGLGGRLLLEEGVGLVPVDVEGSYGRLSLSGDYLTAEREPGRGAVAAALSLSEEDIEECWYGGMGLRFCYVRLATRAAVDGVHLDRPAWAARFAGGWSDDLFVFCGEFASGGELYARCFVPGAGIHEDPATGSACAGLAGGLAHRTALGDGDHELRVQQGVAMGRPSRIQATAHVADGRLASVSAGGHTVVVARGTIRVPEPE